MPLDPSKVWCDPPEDGGLGCKIWNEIMTKEMFRRGQKPTEGEWNAFCLKYYGDKRPMFEW